MQNHSVLPPFQRKKSTPPATQSLASAVSANSSSASEAPLRGHPPSSSSSSSSFLAQNQLVKIFNTALVATQVAKKRDFSSEMRTLTESSAFRAILNAVKQLSTAQKVSERQAAEEVIHTFRQLDDIWGEFVFTEGLDKLRSQKR